MWRQKETDEWDQLKWSILVVEKSSYRAEDITPFIVDHTIGCPWPSEQQQQQKVKRAGKIAVQVVQQAPTLLTSSNHPHPQSNKSNSGGQIYGLYSRQILLESWVDSLQRRMAKAPAV